MRKVSNRVKWFTTKSVGRSMRLSMPLDRSFTPKIVFRAVMRVPVAL